MKDRIKAALDKLNEIRDEVVNYYLTECEKFTANDGNPKSAYRAGLLHDLDKNITNLEMEMKRIAAIEKMNGKKVEMEVIRG